MGVDASKVADILGGVRVLGQDISSLAELQRAVDAGLPIESLNLAAEYVAADSRGVALIKERLVPRATRSRRVRLKLVEGERVERLARLMAIAESVWEDEDDARAFMNEPHPLMEGRTPIEMAETELGARRVEELLMKLEYSLPV
jgi:putative toxin-antitoxin system antitoxin component (TIGR02293 family)